MQRPAFFLAALVFTTAAYSAPDLASPQYGAWGFDTAGMDRSVRPGDDFFSYANGTWIRQTPIPADAASIGYFSDLSLLAARRTHALVEDAAKAKTTDGAQAKVGALYRAFMDVPRLQALGAAPLHADLQRLRSVTSPAALAGFMGDHETGFAVAPFDIELAKDLMAPDRYAVYLKQGGLGLPDRDYYLQPQFAEKKRAYLLYVTRLLTLAGWPTTPQTADAILGFETRIAQASWTVAEQRDPAASYVPASAASLESTAPGFPWRHFLHEAHLDAYGHLVATTDTSIRKIAAIYADTPLDTLKAWEAFRMADGAAPYLSADFSAAHFDFHGKVLSGQPEPRARWKDGIDTVNDILGAALGKMYVAAYLPPAALPEMQRLTTNLTAALRLRLDLLQWMSPETKAEARRKLDHFEVQIGAPRVDRDYAALRITSDDLYGDIVRGRAFDWNRQIALLGNQWDKSAWRFWPQYPTAYNENGQLIFTAAMLQAPFFAPHGDAAINYGAMGAVIGHELTHNFDDQGRHIDSHLRLRDWWSSTDSSRFETAGKRLSAQFSATEILPGLHLNGDATLGENIADLGGLQVALTAYHLSLDGKPAPVVGGYTGDQRVFLGWAQAWRQKRREDALRRQVATDVHSPAPARVNGIVRNIDEWYAAFHIMPGDALYLAPEERVRIW